MGIYGPARRGESLSNVDLALRGKRFAFEFVCPFTAVPLHDVQFSTGQLAAGYIGGTGGIIQFSLEDADLGSRMNPVGYLVNNSTEVYPKVPMLPLEPLNLGNHYRIVVENIDANPTTNFRSIDGLFSTTVDDLDPENLAFLQYPGENWTSNQRNTPVHNLNFANGRSIGFGYVDCLNSLSRPASNVREMFTPTKTITVTGGALALRGLSTEGTISLAGVTVPLRIPEIQNGWSRFDFPNPITLNQGTTYYLAPTASASAVGIEQGWSNPTGTGPSPVPFSFDTFCHDGHAQELVGSTWQDWNLGKPWVDLQFYLFTV